MIAQILAFLLYIDKSIISIFQLICSLFSSSKTIHFDNGLSVLIHKPFAEGGFSYIYVATGVVVPYRRYALKRIICADDLSILSCRREANVHGMLEDCMHILPLFALKFDVSEGPQTICSMLFPLVNGGSLRDDIVKRCLLDDNVSEERDRMPMKEGTVLVLFRGILLGVLALHDAGLAHCDIKVDNILLDMEGSCGFTDVEKQRSNGGVGIPILIDFGSIRSLVVKPSDRRVVLKLTEDAEQHSTVSYRAPELFEGGCRYGPKEPDVDGKTDVWSCGCVLYAIMYGSSPFETEFRCDGSIRVVDCTFLRILGGKVPFPPKNTDVAHRYSVEIQELVQWILNVDRVERPSLEMVMERVENMLVLGREWGEVNRRKGFDQIMM